MIENKNAFSTGMLAGIIVGIIIALPLIMIGLGNGVKADAYLTNPDNYVVDTTTIIIRAIQ